MQEEPISVLRTFKGSFKYKLEVQCYSKQQDGLGKFSSETSEHLLKAFWAKQTHLLNQLSPEAELP